MLMKRNNVVVIKFSLLPRFFLDSSLDCVSSPPSFVLYKVIYTYMNLLKIVDLITFRIIVDEKSFNKILSSLNKNDHPVLFLRLLDDYEHVGSR